MSTDTRFRSQLSQTSFFHIDSLRLAPGPPDVYVGPCFIVYPELPLGPCSKVVLELPVGFCSMVTPELPDVHVGLCPKLAPKTGFIVNKRYSNCQRTDVCKDALLCSQINPMMCVIPFVSKVRVPNDMHNLV